MKQNSTNSKGSSQKSQSREWFEALIIAALVAMVLRMFVVESYRIPTGSMEKTLLAGDFLFVNKFVYGAKVPFTDIHLPKVDDVKRGDIIVFKFPRDRSLNYIKRCVALPGDTLQIKEQKLYVNGKLSPLPPHAQFIGEKMPPGVPDYQIFPAMSDYNKDNYGPIRIPRKGDVVKLTMRTIPLYRDMIEEEGHSVSLSGDQIFIDGVPADHYSIEKDHYFAMGDNRDNSLDSRYWGFLSDSDLVGQAMMVYWSWDPDLPLLFDPVEKITSIRWDRIGLVVH
ncbi:signal peptidase I [Chlorobaculum parvum NCIB 8327]|uniref:Signal peptidase I n=1 Tax=Chlorobaculum parvum (strain DSM 263 / NCIMB 8327) TaxID=517417 RepID=B3QPU2_CHLP8|nr:signal peptidase I [Chlorobaculum parvum]ACF11945.1 signal peptidase I [Chlorobaculum parvum NCIB 8327]